MNLQVVPDNVFSGVVTLVCPTNLPTNTTCTFSSATVNVTPGTPAPFSVTFQTTGQINPINTMIPRFPASSGRPPNCAALGRLRRDCGNPAGVHMDGAQARKLSPADCRRRWLETLASARDASFRADRPGRCGPRRLQKGLHGARFHARGADKHGHHRQCSKCVTRHLHHAQRRHALNSKPRKTGRADSLKVDDAAVIAVGHAPPSLRLLRAARSARSDFR